jgi:hypothetical protein
MSKFRRSVHKERNKYEVALSTGMRAISNAFASFGRSYGLQYTASLPRPPMSEAAAAGDYISVAS